MTLPDETTNHNHNAELHPGPVSTRSGDARDARASGQSTSLADKVRERWKVPVPTEDTRTQAHRPPRSPWTEDYPSPRCVLQDYREAAVHYGGEAAGIRWLYWAIAVVPLAFNMGFAAGHFGSQRPARFWGTALAVSLFVIGLLVFT